MMQALVRWARRAVGHLILPGLAALSAGPAGAQAADPGAQGFYRMPALRGQALYFVAEGDLWRVGVEGGRAERISSHPGLELHPAVSPDGRWLAFSAHYDGGLEAYRMPIDGGLPQRLTHDGRPLGALFFGQGHVVQGFGPQGELLVAAGAESGRRDSQLYLIDPATLARRTLPVGQASDGAFSADGRTLYFTRGGIPLADNARAYRGGAMARLWQIEPAGSAEARPLLALEANALRPMPYRAGGQDRVAFLSDRDGFYNLWSVNAQGGDLRQHSRHRDWDIRSAAIDGTRVAYALGADLYLLDLATGGAPRRVPITLGSDFDQRRARWVAPAAFYTHAAPAPDGQRVVISARGKLATQGTGVLRRAELPVPADAACRDGVFSHDSRHVLAVCDMGGETEVWQFPADGSGSPRALSQGARVTRLALYPSPDGRWLAHTDMGGQLWLSTLASGPEGSTLGAPKLLNRAAFGRMDRALRWSNDGRWLVYEHWDPTTGREGLTLYDTGSGRSLPLASDRYVARDASFTPDGHWLFYVAERHFESDVSSPWGDRNFGPSFELRARVYALALKPDARFPFRPRDELQPGSGTPPRAAAASAPASATATAGAPATAPNDGLSGLTQRLYQLPLPPSRYSQLRSDGKRLFFLETDSATDRQTLKSIALDDSGASADTLATDTLRYELTPDGKRLMVVRNAPSGSGTPGLPARAGDILLFDTAARLPAESARAQVRWQEWRIATDPPAEWRQIFHEAWRLQRDHHWDPGLRGVDWAAQRRQYAALLPRLTDRHELTELLAQMVTALGTLHSRSQAADVRGGPDTPAPAALGGRLSPVAAGWRVDRIFSGDPELPDQASPLAEAGIREGEVITALNGRSLAGAPPLGALLQGQAGRQVLLELSPGGAGPARRVVLQPVTLAREATLRLTDWEWQNARRTLERSDGRIGYLRLRDMGTADIGTFAREFYAHFHREGLIIDARGNWGGNIDEWVLEKLSKRRWMYWQGRIEGAPPYPNMRQTFAGHLVVLIDHQTYSDGETLAEGVRQLRLGTLIGTRTAGAGVWLSDQNRQIDRGLLRAAETATFLPEAGRWLIEREGVAPDIEVDNPPRASASGGDAQLDAAIAHLQARMAEKPLQRPRPPAYPRDMGR